MWGLGVLLPWAIILNTFDFMKKNLGDNPDPDFTLTSAVYCMWSITQFMLVFFGHKLSERLKLQYMWIIAAVLIFIVPFVTVSLKEKGYAVVFILLAVFGCCNGLL